MSEKLELEQLPAAGEPAPVGLNAVGDLRRLSAVPGRSQRRDGTDPDDRR